MKVLNRAGFCLLALLLLFIAAVPVRADTGDVFTVTPSGGDDTAALQAAFDAAKAAGPGSVVQLVEGEYLISQVDAFDFNGAFLGKGMDKTIVRALPNLVCDFADWSVYPVLIRFSGYDITISDMYLEVPEKAPCQPYGGFFGDATTALEAIVMIEGFQPYPPVDVCEYVFGEPVHIVIDRVAFIGAPHEDPATYQEQTSYNLVGGLEIWDYCEPRAQDKSDPSIKITRSRFEYNQLALAMGFLWDMNIQVGGSPAEGNYFNSVFYGVNDIYDRNVVAEESYNIIHDVYNAGFIPWAYGANELSYYHFHHNTIDVAGWGNGIFIQDNIDPLVLNMEVTQNTINLSGPDQWGVVSIVSDNALIANNRIRGSGGMGVFAGGDWYEGVTTTNLLIKANNFNKADFGWAPIVLGPTSAYCTVVGGNNHTNVVDLGTGNILTGVNNGGKKMGQTVSAKMQQLASVRRMVRGKP